MPPPLPPAPSLKGEWSNIWLLLALYFLQGIPIGLASSLPLILSAKGASFSDQALFSLASWPYSLKLLWAPIVDSLHTSRWRLGQRKSWVVPCQLLTGAVMIAVGERVGDFFPGGEGGAAGAVNVPGLLATFLVMVASGWGHGVSWWQVTRHVEYDHIPWLRPAQRLPLRWRITSASRRLR
jgi:PAT family acetyl-CoA transporter-like MFS transporter 1